jgi:flagellar protein FliO/FliZ
MKFTFVILAAALCLNAHAESSIDQRSDDALIAAAEQLIAEGEQNAGKKTEQKAEAKADAKADAKAEDKADAKTEASTSEAIASMTGHGSDETDTRKESEIPVVLTSTKESKANGNIIWRLVASLGVLVLVAGGLVVAGKRWTRQKDKGGNKARIEIMHQLHLGPKRSVALIRVSGETMLIGITDHNVSMIKAVTLIDDELENAVTQDFNGFLEDEFSIEDVRNALGPTTMR